MSDRTIKTLFHSAMAVAALLEWHHARTGMRKGLAGAFAGFHVSCAIYDFKR